MKNDDFSDIYRLSVDNLTNHSFGFPRLQLTQIKVASTGDPLFERHHRRRADDKKREASLRYDASRLVVTFAFIAQTRHRARRAGFLETRAEKQKTVGVRSGRIPGTPMLLTSPRRDLVQVNQGVGLNNG